ncbi:CHAT domain-containing protein [Acidobacteriota bacterium]
MTIKTKTKSVAFLLLLLLNFTQILLAETITVPSGCPTIKKAVSLARDGDVVEVEDGIYLEENIIIDKKIHVRAKNLYGAFIEGTTERRKAIFVIRAETEIEGFVLLNAESGILQRGSPDITWSAHDLVIMNMNCGIYINDMEARIGFANLYNIIVDGSSEAFSTNDARGFDIQNCFVSNCETVFKGSNHDSFFVDKISILNCERLSMEDSMPSSPLVNNTIEFGPDIFVLDDLVEKTGLLDISSAYGRIYKDIENKGLENIENFGSLRSIAFNTIGEVYFRLGRLDDAADWCKKALILGDKMKTAVINTYAYFNLARIAENKGEYIEAIDLYKNAIAGIEKMRTALPLTDQRVIFLRSKINIYESFINLLFEQHKREPLAGYDKEAFYFVEKSKARSFIESLEESRINFEIHLDPELKAEKRDILEKMAELQRELNTKSLIQNERQSLLDELIKTNSEYESLMIQIREESPEYADLFIPQPYRYSTVKEKILDKETALLEFFLGEQNSFAFLATLEGLFVSRIPEPGSLTQLVDNYRLFLTLKGTGRFRAGQGGKRIYDLLIGPFVEQIGKNIKKLIIVPDGCLNRLPFETLVRESDKLMKEKPGTLNYLIYDYELSYAASASLLINLSKTKNKEENKMDLLGIANPRFQDSELRYVKKEIETISKLFKKKRIRLLVNNKATERNFKSSNLIDYKIVHLATHGVIYDEYWWRSALFFFPDQDNQEDGQLQLIDINNLKFNSELVVLSACQTGEGKIEKAEGILGFTQAFLNAGTESVLASLWEIDDKTTPLFMKYFYTYLKAGVVKSKALQLAKIQMINSGFAHPFYWAAFILLGVSHDTIVF